MLKIGLLAASIAMLFTFPAGCMTRDHRPTAYADLTRRASFDLRCDSVKITPIHEDEFMSCLGTVHNAQTAGVTCGEQRATYELVAGRWIMNNESGGDQQAK